MYIDLQILRSFNAQTLISKWVPFVPPLQFTRPLCYKFVFGQDFLDHEPDWRWVLQMYAIALVCTHTLTPNPTSPPPYSHMYTTHMAPLLRQWHYTCRFHTCYSPDPHLHVYMHMYYISYMCVYVYMCVCVCMYTCIVCCGCICLHIRAIFIRVIVLIHTCVCICTCNLYI